MKEIGVLVVMAALFAFCGFGLEMAGFKSPAFFACYGGISVGLTLFVLAEAQR